MGLFFSVQLGLGINKSSLEEFLKKGNGYSVSDKIYLAGSVYTLHFHGERKKVEEDFKNAPFPYKLDFGME